MNTACGCSVDLCSLEYHFYYKPQSIIIIIIIIMYLYSVQYLHVLQDSKHYLTNPTVQVQPQLTSN